MKNSAIVGDPDGRPSRTTSTVIRFGDCEIDFGRFEMRRRGALVHVEPQVFDVLAYLVSHRERMVPKHELLDEVWGSRFVSESALATRIRAARAAVGDDGQRQEVIHTVHGRGYRFIAEVEVEEPELPTPGPVATIAPAPPTGNEPQPASCRTSTSAVRPTGRTSRGRRSVTGRHW